jgi:hypothetical protein
MQPGTEWLRRHHFLMHQPAGWIIRSFHFWTAKTFAAKVIAALTDAHQTDTPK